jgi:hypothetical protein
MIVRPLKSVWRFARNELSGKPGAVQSQILNGGVGTFLARMRVTRAVA